MACHSSPDAFSATSTTHGNASSITTLGDPPHAVAIPLKPQAISIVFYFVKPLGAGGNRLAERR